MTKKVFKLGALACSLIIAISIVIILLSGTKRNFAFMTNEEKTCYIMNYLTESLIKNYESEYDLTTGKINVDLTKPRR